MAMGMNEIQNEPIKLATWPSWPILPNLSTTSCPRRLLMVQPSPQKLAVNPTVVLPKRKRLESIHQLANMNNDMFFDLIVLTNEIEPSATICDIGN